MIPTNNFEIDQALTKARLIYSQHLNDIHAEDKSIDYLMAFFESQLEDYPWRERVDHLLNEGVLTKNPIGLLYSDELERFLEITWEGYYDSSFLSLLRYVKSYCLKDSKGVLMEYPHESVWRVVCHLLEGSSLQTKLEAYSLIWKYKAFTVATPMLMQALTPMKNNASCFLLQVEEDSLDGIYNTIKDMALISKSAGGIGVDFTKVRARGSHIKGTNGASNGIMPFLRLLNEQALAVDQGGGKRKGSISVYLEPWHADFREFVQCTSRRANMGMQCLNLFTAVYTNDVFMRAVENDDDWYMFCPTKAPLLLETWGEEFEKHYQEYVKKGVYNHKVRAKDLFLNIESVMIETGRPYMVNKDAVNANTLESEYYGIIRSSNLCAEITETTHPDYVAVCTLGSIALPRFVEFSSETKQRMVDLLVTMLNNSINAHHDVDKTHDHVNRRPIGVGWQGVHDFFIKEGIPLDSEEAVEKMGNAQEELQSLLVNASEKYAKKHNIVSSIFQRGCPDTPRANSMVSACMPTKSTSALLGWSEGIDPLTALVETRKFDGNSLTFIPHSVTNFLHSKGLLTTELLKDLVSNHGSVQNIPYLPSDVKEVLKTGYEVGNKALIDLAVARQKNVDQSQSMNLFLNEASTSKLYSALMYGWEKGLKTLAYYTHVKDANFGNNFVSTVDKPEAPQECSITDEECESCSG